MVSLQHRPTEKNVEDMAVPGMAMIGLDMAARRVGTSPLTIIDWIAGCHLSARWTRQGWKVDPRDVDDVATRMGLKKAA
ncbi:hypothetical protein [Frankia sp. EAN1pec]|uniref:hypothetical protein n=1 Tax=Parafrankia sp. (strain EAN1pec) TaxID=298653 RepID=UPI00059BE705